MDRQYWALVHDSKDFARDVRELEDQGFAGMEMGQFYAPPFIPLSAAAMVTTRLQLASGIVMGLTRSPFETAMAAIEVDRLSKGRFTLGLGVGPEHFTSGYFGMPYDKPVSRLKEVVEIFRHVEANARAGTMTAWEGKCYQLEFDAYAPIPTPCREHIPVWLAALRGRMCELAGEVADGLIGHPVWSVEWALNQAQESLAIGAAKAGRDPSAIHFQPWVAVSIDSNVRAALDDAKPHVAFYAGFAQYMPFFEAHGFGPEALKLQEAAKSMDCVKAGPLVPDEMVRTFVACGTPDQVRERVEPLWQRANSMLIFTPGFGLAPDVLEARKAAMSRTFFS